MSRVFFMYKKLKCTYRLKRSRLTWALYYVGSIAGSTTPVAASAALCKIKKLCRISAAEQHTLKSFLMHASHLEKKRKTSVDHKIKNRLPSWVQDHLYHTWQHIVRHTSALIEFTQKAQDACCSCVQQPVQTAHAVGANSKNRLSWSSRGRSLCIVLKSWI